MKLIIQIPCYNEEENLPATVRDLPRSIEGIDLIEYMVVDDGSTDRTVDVAKSLGVHHIIELGTNHGLATVFKRGVEYALMQGADIVVNTDADNQYNGHDIANLVRPILENKADFVVGCRPIVDHPEFRSAKKSLQLMGSWTLRRISKTSVRDAASGFRAFSRSCCQRLFIHSRFSYCMETLIQAGNTGMRVASVDIRVNPKTRDSRLFKSIPQYIIKSGGTMLTMFLLYRPAFFFSTIATAMFAAAFLLGVRFLYYYFQGAGDGMIQSLILLSILAFTSFLFFALAIIGELLKSNRKILEEILYQQRKANVHK
ncbi:MAG: glycosyltransferase family 2 protein [Planctomycetaceae bacterium]|nr:glycosyltransferase family 2 protein [Planctomycetaceae bacterium]